MKKQTIRNQKNTTLTVKIGENIKILFDKHCQEEGRDKKWVVTTAIRDYLIKTGDIK